MNLNDENFDDSEYYGESEEEDVDHEHYKGIYFDEEPGQKYQCPDTGAHFEFNMMCTILDKVSAERRQWSVEP